jgi:thiol-disulfide isomerase/thioredoxin
MHRRRVLIALGTVAVLAVLAIGLSQAGSKSGKPAKATLSLAEQRRMLAGAPAPLAELHARGSQLLGGGPKAMRAQLKALRGYPVVINKWASWCPPCRLESPIFQRVAAKLGKQVAFLGLDGKDAAGDARQFLRQIPLSYPSYQDPDERVARTLEAGAYYPTTVFIDAKGNRTVHQGGYTDEARLEQDIRRYALNA